METLLTDILQHDNAARQRAEAELNNQRTSNPAALLQLFIGNMSNANPEIAQVSCLLFKKYFLDNKEGVNPEDYEQMKQAVMSSLDFATQKMLLLKQKGDLLSKIFMLQEKNEELLGLLVQWAQAENSESKQFAMYVFERQAECHLPLEQLKAHKDSFFTIFEKSLQDADIKVRVAALRAAAAFLISIEENQEAIVAQFRALIPHLFTTIVDSLKADSTLGSQALESMVDLSKTHPMFWKDNCAQLVKIVSDIAKMQDFEEGIRSQAAEIVLTLAEQVPATVRKVNEVKTEFFPALIQMLTNCEEDMDAWTESQEDEFGTGNDVYSIGISSIERMAGQMKEKLTLDACSGVIGQCLANEDWKIRQAGYIASGLVTQACKDHMKSNMQSAFETAAKGIQDPHLRVKYAGLFCLAQLLVTLKPAAQKTYHAELVPVLLNIASTEAHVKVQTMAVSTLFYFTNGLIEEDKNEIQDTKKSSDIIAAYSDDLFKSLVINLQKGIQANYEPLQEQVMNLLNSAATLIEDDFAKYFNEFMPLMVQILQNVESKTPSQMRLRARTIESMGYIIASVAEKPEFAATVKEVTTMLFNQLNQETSQDDPQVLAIKDTLSKIAYYLKDDFHAVAPKFLEILIKDAQTKITINLDSDVVPTQQAQPSTVKSFSFKMHGMESEQRLSLNTSDLENKISAFHHIMKVALAMGTGFEPYVAQVLPVIQLHMDYTSRILKKYALKTFQHVLAAKAEKPEEQIALFRQTFELFALHIIKANKAENVKDMKLYFKELFHCMRVIADGESADQLFADQAKLGTFGTLMKNCLQTVAIQKELKMQIIEEKHQSAQIDEEDVDEVQTELYKITSASIYINECCSILMDVYGPSVKDLLNENAGFYYASVIQHFETAVYQELQDSLFFFINFIDKVVKGSDQMFAYEITNQFLGVAMKAKKEDIEVRQNAIYGIGVFAKYISPATFKSLIPNVKQAIDHQVSTATEEDELVVKENAYITLGFLSVYHETGDINTFLQMIPFKGEDEAAEAYQFVIEKALEQNKVLVGAGGAVKEALQKMKQHATENSELLEEEIMGKLDQALAM